MPKFSWRFAGWSFAIALWLTPLVAMQFTDEVQWRPESFALFAVLLGSVGGGIELAVRRSRDWAYRTGAVVALVTGFVLVWMNLAVGVLGGEDNPQNLLFFAMVALGIFGSAAVRFRPLGMACALLAMACAQAAIPLAAGVGQLPVLVLTLGFTGLWLLAAGLFYSVARRQAGGAAL